jgi:hypothetical protein
VLNKQFSTIRKTGVNDGNGGTNRRSGTASTCDKKTSRGLVRLLDSAGRKANDCKNFSKADQARYASPLAAIGSPELAECSGSEPMSCDPFADLIDLILLMHSICTPTAIIAARSHAPESVVKHVIEFGELPDVELGPPWQPEPRQPTPTRVSDR